MAIVTLAVSQKSTITTGILATTDFLSDAYLLATTDNQFISPGITNNIFTT